MSRAVARLAWCRADMALRSSLGNPDAGRLKRGAATHAIGVSIPYPTISLHGRTPRAPGRV